MRKFQWAGVLLFVCFLHASAVLSQDAQTELNRALELKKQGRIEQAISAVESALKLDRNFARAHYELALLQQVKRTPVSLKQAEQSLLTALRLSPGNTEYIAALAGVYEDRLMHPVAITMWERILDNDPGNVGALNGIARLKVKENEKYRYRVDSVDGWYFYDYNMLEYDKWDWDEQSFLMTPALLEQYKRVEIMPPVRWDDHIARDEAEIVALNRKILDVDPGNREALARLGILAFNKVKYQSSFESDKLLDGYRQDKAYLDTCAFYFKKLVDFHPDDKDGRLFLGLAYFRLKEYDSAYGQFTKARSLMSEGELAVFENVGYLKVGGLREENIRTSAQDTSKFWVKRDPMYFTQYNERELEHYSRVAEANLRFSVPRRGIEGWRTDRGKILIKYGPPENRVSYKKSEKFALPTNRVDENWDPLSYREDEFWHYDNFAFVFEKSWGDPEEKYRFSIWGGMNFDEISVRVEEEYPEYYTYEPKGELVEFHYDIVDFRGKEGRTRIDIIYGVPFNNLRFEQRRNMWAGQMKTGLFLFDTDWERVLTDTLVRNMNFDLTAIDTSSDDLAMDQFTHSIEPGFYNLSIEIMDNLSDNAGSYKEFISVEAYGYDSLQLSDIQLAQNIMFLFPDLPVARDNILLTPKPHRFFRLNESIFIYYEVYNLLPDPRTNRTDFTGEYSIRKTGDEPKVLDNFVKLLTLNWKEEKGVTTTFRYYGDNREEPQFLRIDHAITEPGIYELSLRIIDNVRGSAVKKSVQFRMFEIK